MTSESTGKLAEALAKAQGQIKGAVKDAKNPHFKSSYADLSSVWDACRKALAENGLSVLQFGAPDSNGTWVLMTRLQHISGEFIQGGTPLLMGKQDMQALGSAMTYARRYGLAAMVGVVADDDDGNAAVASEPAKASERVEPEGFQTWADDMHTIADEGTDALRKAWQESNAEFRMFAGNAFLDKLKAKARSADAHSVPA